MSSLATGLIEDAWSLRIRTVVICLFGFVIILIEEEEGRRETYFALSRVGQRYKGNKADADTAGDVARFPNTFIG